MNLKNDKNYKTIQLPYEKCISNGPHSLTDVELMAVLLRCGTKYENVLTLADKILSLYKTNSKFLNLSRATFEELVSIKGIGKVKAVQIMCVFELAKRIAREPFKESIQVQSPNIIAGMFMQEMRLLDTEHVYLLLLNNKNSIIKKIVLSKGSVNASVLEPREVFVQALKYNAVNILLIHNHPSGDPTPSEADKNISIRINSAGQLIGISLVDHIIIGDNVFVSLRQEGIF